MTRAAESQAQKLFIAHQTLQSQEAQGVQHTHSSSGAYFSLAALHSLLTELSRRSTGEAVTPFQSRVIPSMLCIANALLLPSPAAPILPGCSRQGSVHSLWPHLAEIRVINKTSHSHSADCLDSQQEGMLHLKASAVISNVTQYVTKCHLPGFFPVMTV